MQIAVIGLDGKCMNYQINVAVCVTDNVENSKLRDLCLAGCKLQLADNNESNSVMVLSDGLREGKEDSRKEEINIFIA